LKGTRPHKRLGVIRKILSLTSTSKSQKKAGRDPFLLFQKQLAKESSRQKEIAASVEEEIKQIVKRTLEVSEGGIEV